MRVTFGVIVAVGLVLVTPRHSGGQSRQLFSIQGSALGEALQGNAYSGLAAGAGFEVQGRVTPGAWSLGAGYQYTLHSYKLASGSTDFTLSGPFVEPRIVIPTRSGTVFPYLSGRFSYLTLSGTPQGNDASATGVVLNGGGGVLIVLGRRVNLDLGATFGYAKFDDLTIRDSFGGSLTQAQGSGSNIIARGGLAIGLGK